MCAHICIHVSYIYIMHLLHVITYVNVGQMVRSGSGQCGWGQYKFSNRKLIQSDVLKLEEFEKSLITSKLWGGCVEAPSISVLPWVRNNKAVTLPRTEGTKAKSSSCYPVGESNRTKAALRDVVKGHSPWLLLREESRGINTLTDFIFLPPFIFLPDFLTGWTLLEVRAGSALM